MVFQEQDSSTNTGKFEKLVVSWDLRTFFPLLYMYYGNGLFGITA